MDYYITYFWTIVGFATILRNFLPEQLVDSFQNFLQSWLNYWRPFSFYKVPQYRDVFYYNENVLYTRVATYVSSLKGTIYSSYANLHGQENSRVFTVSLEDGQTVEDEFMGAKLWWIHQVVYRGERQNPSKSFVLKIPKTDQKTVLQSYLEHVQVKAEDIELKKRQILLFTNTGSDADSWTSVSFKHPATFQTVALDADLKNKIKKDLDAFVGAKEYYHSLGRAWKRGYLLYGPPGTGKSSMIAAMANHLHYNVYDLELMKVRDNSELRTLLMQTSNRSILVIEDIDCSIDLSCRTGLPFSNEDPNKREDVKGEKESGTVESVNEKSKVTLSGVLNFIDGLWSCCGEERIIVFTTNNKEKLDPALLRPGRMDMHLYFPPCTFSIFKIMAQTYLHLKEHEMFPLVEEAFKSSSVSLTPAEIGEILLSNRDSFDSALKAVISALKKEKPD